MAFISKTIEHYEKLFGIIAIEKGFISPNDLSNALSIQVKEHNENGNQRFIREILFDHDIMSVNQIGEVCKVIFQNNPDYSVTTPLKKKKLLPFNGRVRRSGRI